MPRTSGATSSLPCAICCGGAAVPGAACRLPHEFPPWQTLYQEVRGWRLAGTWERVTTQVREQVRLRTGRASPPTAPTAAMLGSQSARTTEKGGVLGYDGAKPLSGGTRHVLVATGGLVLRAVVHPANLADRNGAMAVLQERSPPFPAVTSVWGDRG